MVTLHADGATSREIIASVAEAVRADASVPEDLARLRKLQKIPPCSSSALPSQEKGYALYGSDGALLPAAAQDAAQGPDHVRHAMGVTASLLYRRWQAGGFPVAVVSMDNCSRNGEKLRPPCLPWPIFGRKTDWWRNRSAPGSRMRTAFRSRGA